jgi:hypothetical protein
LLEKTVLKARELAEQGAREALATLGVDQSKAFEHLSPGQRQLRNQLRARGRQAGDSLDASGRQTINHLVGVVGYEHWHRMLFARFLAENSLLLEPEHKVPVSLTDVEELARDAKVDVWELAGRYAQRMLPEVFRADDPVLVLPLAREARTQLERLVADLPREVFLADDSLGWTYQFWQAQRKEDVNRTGVKIGADELSPVTQLFTEDYIVDFMLHNTLGAWHAGKLSASAPLAGDTEEALRAAVALPDHSWSYLRWVKNESGDWTPAAGTFATWPRRAAELTVLDPCMGSGHFLVAALPLLARLRMAEENISPAAAARAVLRDNLHGLELDPRCAQFAGFNLALTAWKFAPELLHEPEPLTLHLACCGLQLEGTESEWHQIAREAAGRSGLGGDNQLFPDKESLDGALEDRVVIGMRGLHGLFRRAPVLGSLIDPRQPLAGEMALFTDWDALAPLLQQALAGEASNDAESHELAVQVQGLAKAAELLAKRYHLVVTNVPYLARGKQEEVLRQHCERIYPEAKPDLATCFVERCIAFCQKGGSTALVTPQNWLFLGSYKHLRQRLLREVMWDSVIRLGTRAFDTIGGEVVNVALVTLTRQSPAEAHPLAGLDASADRTPAAKAITLNSAPVITVSQKGQLGNPDGAVSFAEPSKLPRLSQYTVCKLGLGTGDLPHYLRNFWELPIIKESWGFYQTTTGEPGRLQGLDTVVAWDAASQRVAGMTAEERQQAHNQDYRGREVWGKTGIAISMMRGLPTCAYHGALFDKMVSVVVPKDPNHLAALSAFTSSKEFTEEVRRLDQKLMVTNATLVKVPFDLAHWQRVAAEKYPNGLPKPHSDDPTQWIFNGHPKGSEQPLHVAVARLLGYRWPRQMGSSFPDCPALGADGLESHVDRDGIVCLSALRGERAAADRLHALLSAALGDYDERALLRATESGSESLELWLRDDFFEQHCALFHQRPFVWHFWDGRKDGFHALVNYHQLAAPEGAGRKLLETLTYSYLGDWIRKQQDGMKRNESGAEDRFIAAQVLQKELEAILKGEAPHDLFVRWKPLYQQPIDWEPDINDGVRLNIRPFMLANDVGRKGAGLLRVKPGIKWDKDRGAEPERAKKDFPWFWKWDEKTEDFIGGREFDGCRWNSCHYTTAAKRAARERDK